jgi:hypothetical protein
MCLLGFLIAGVWVSVSASAVADDLSLTSNLTSRDPSTGAINWDAQITVTVASNGFCPSNSYSCQVVLLANLASGGVTTLATKSVEASPAATADSPVTSAFRTFHVTGATLLPQVTSMFAQAVQYGLGTVKTTDPVAVTDQLPAATLSLNVNSLSRDPLTGDLQWDVSATSAYYALPGGPCTSPYGCTMRLQARTSPTSWQDLATASLPLVGPNGGALTYPFTNKFVGHARASQVDALRLQLQPYSVAPTMTTDPVAVTDQLPQQTANIVINSVLRDPATGNLTWDVSASASYYSLPGASCVSPYGCSMLLQARTGLTTWATIASTSLPLGGANNSALTYPFAFDFKGQTSIATINALRVQFQAYSSPAGYSSGMVSTGENVSSGHDLDSALDLLVAGISSSAEPCITAIPVGTNARGSSVNDQALTCMEAVQSGTTLREFFKGYLKTISPRAVASLLVNAGIQQSKDTAASQVQMDYGFPLPTGCVWVGLMSISCSQPSGPPTLHRPTSAPPQQDQVWEDNQKANAQRQRNATQQQAPVIPSPGPGDLPGPLDSASAGDIDIALAEQCQADLTKWGATAGLPDDACETMPIFGTGAESPQATKHDLDAITANPALMKLTYVKGAEKVGSRGNWSATPPCDTMAAGYQCDEYPYFSTEEGFPAQVPDLRPIPGVTDNQVQGGYLSNFYRNCPVLQTSAQSTLGRQFLVVPMPVPIPTVTYCPAT